MLCHKTETKKQLPGPYHRRHDVVYHYRPIYRRRYLSIAICVRKSRRWGTGKMQKKLTNRHIITQFLCDFRHSLARK